MMFCFVLCLKQLEQPHDLGRGAREVEVDIVVRGARGQACNRQDRAVRREEAACVMSTLRECGGRRQHNTTQHNTTQHNTTRAGQQSTSRS